MTWAPAHWRALLSVAALALTFATGYGLGKSHPQPAVALHEDTALQRASVAASDTSDSKGAARITTTTEEFGPAAGALASVPSTGGVAPAVPHTEHPIRRTVTVEERGPEVITQHATEQATVAEQSHVSLTVTPQPPYLATRAFQVGFENALGKQDLRLAIRDGFRVPLIGLPVEAEVSFVPSRGFRDGWGAALAFKF